MTKAPTLLKFLSWARDRHGEPIFGDRGEYVSLEYPTSVCQGLVLLGVTSPDWTWVCGKLLGLHNAGLLLAKLANLDWYSDAAKVILEPQEPRDSTRYARDLRTIPLIQLADGNWRCPPSGNDRIYFPATDGTTIPPGLPFNLVNDVACACPNRVNLFRLLGVRNCNVPNVVERILHYHSNYFIVQHDHIIAQLKYLYNMRAYLGPDDMGKIYFSCPTKTHYVKGFLTYAATSVNGELQQLLSGYGEAHFLDERYFADLDPLSRVTFVEWLAETAGVALVPRLIATQSPELHQDFDWLLKNKGHQALSTLRQHWDHYSRTLTIRARDTIADAEFACESRSVSLRGTYIPLPTLVEKAQAFGEVKDFNFLALPSDDPENWTFLYMFGVGVDEGLDFHLWLLYQWSYITDPDATKSKQLYLAIQARSFTPADEEKVK